MNDIQDPRLTRAFRNARVPGARPGFFEDLEETLEEMNPHKRIFTRRRIIASIATPVAAASIALALIVNGQGGNPSPKVATTEPTPLLAAQVVEKGSRAMQNVETLSVSIHLVEHSIAFGTGGETRPEDVTATIRLRSNGDYYYKTDSGLNETGYAEERSYDAAKDEFVGCGNRFDEWNCGKSSGISGFDQPPLLGLETFSSVLRGMSSANDVRLVDDVYNERKVWKLDAPYKAYWDRPMIGTAEVIVDQETSFPLSVTTTLNGKPFQEVTVDDLSVNPQLTDADFKVVRPKAADLPPETGEFHRTSVDTISDKVGYKAVLPADIPQGFELSHVSYSKSDVGSGNRNVALYVYKQGLETVIITTREFDPAQKPTDPIFSGNDQRSEKRELTLSSGYFKDINVDTISTTQNVHLWGAADKLLFTIEGDLTPDQLIEAANSFALVK